MVDGTVLRRTSEYQPKATPEDLREVFAYRREEDGFHGRTVGKNIFVLEGSKKSSIRSVELSSKGWKPDVRVVYLVPDKK